MILRPLFFKALGVIALCVAMGVAAQSVIAWVTDRARLDAIEGMGQVVIRQTDTLHAGNVKRFEDAKADYEAARDTADSIEELSEALVEADHALQSCTLVMASCDARVAARDSLIKALMRPRKEPLVRPWVEGMYDPAAKQFVPRAGADVRLPHNLSLTVAGEIADKPRVLVGIRKSW